MLNSIFSFSELLKRNGLSLDFIDSLLNDPMFAEPGDDYQDDSFLHGNTFNEVTNHDDNSFLHGNTFNEVHNDENDMLAQVLAPEKDPMSNVIPGMKCTNSFEYPQHMF